MSKERAKYCPKCKSRYAWKAQQCDVCGQALVEYLPEKRHERKLTEEKMVTIKVAQDWTQAELMRGILEANDIKCLLVGNVPVTVFPLTVDGLAEVRIRVLESDEKRALEVLKAYLPKEIQ